MLIELLLFNTLLTQTALLVNQGKEGQRVLKTLVCFLRCTYLSQRCVFSSSLSWFTSFKCIVRAPYKGWDYALTREFKCWNNCSLLLEKILNNFLCKGNVWMLWMEIVGVCCWKKTVCWAVTSSYICSSRSICWKNWTGRSASEVCVQGNLMLLTGHINIYVLKNWV